MNYKMATFSEVCLSVDAGKCSAIIDNSCVTEQKYSLSAVNRLYCKCRTQWASKRTRGRGQFQENHGRVFLPPTATITTLHTRAKHQFSVFDRCLRNMKIERIVDCIYSLTYNRGCDLEHIGKRCMSSSSPHSLDRDSSLSLLHASVFENDSVRCFMLR